MTKKISVVSLRRPLMKMRRIECDEIDGRSLYFYTLHHVLYGQWERRPTHVLFCVFVFPIPLFGALQIRTAAQQQQFFFLN